jgi:transcriptional regulator with XRE-family HTH domain
MHWATVGRVCPQLSADLIAYRRHVGDRLRTLRARAGLTQQALAERAGLDKQAVSLIENGHQSPRLDTLWRLARALDVPVTELVTDAPT